MQSWRGFWFRLIKHAFRLLKVFAFVPPLMEFYSFLNSPICCKLETIYNLRWSIRIIYESLFSSLFYLSTLDLFLFRPLFLRPASNTAHSYFTCSARNLLRSHRIRPVQGSMRQCLVESIVPSSSHRAHSTVTAYRQIPVPIHISGHPFWSSHLKITIQRAMTSRKAAIYSVRVPYCAAVRTCERQLNGTTSSM